MGFENPFKRFKKIDKEKAVSGAVAAAALVGAVATGPIPQVIEAFQKDKSTVSREAAPSQTKPMTQSEDGTPVSIDLKQNVITVGLPKEEIKNIDLQQPMVDIALKQPVTDIDLTQKVAEMRPPEGPLRDK